MAGTMRAGVLVERGRVEVRELPIPALTEERDVLIRAEVGSICGSDLHQIMHEWEPHEVRQPGFPCHETVGIVVESRAPSFAPGDRVLATPNLLHAAGFAEYQVLPSRFLIRVEDTALEPTQIVLAQQLGTTIFAAKRFWQGPGGETAVIIGAGSGGLGFTSVVAQAGFRNIVQSDPRAARTAAAEELGATHTVTAAEGVVELVMELTDGAGADLVIEASGTDVGRYQSFDAVKREGQIGLFGMNEGEGFFFPYKRVFRSMPTISMRWDAQTEPGQASFRQALDWIATGIVDPGAYRFRGFDIEELPQALQIAADATDGFIKGGVVFS